MQHQNDSISKPKAKPIGERNGNHSRKSFFRRFWWIGLIAVFLCAIVVIKILKKSGDNPIEEFKKNDDVSETMPCTTKAAPDPTTDGITWTLPDCASDVRLIFPYSMEEVFYSLDTGLTGYGVHAGQHIEGLDHVWIELSYGTPIRSWADGTVVKVDVSGDIEQSEIQVTIDYGQNLYGVHMELKSSLLTVGDKVTAGQTVGVGFDFINNANDNKATSGEFALIDLNRGDGIYDFFDSPSTVSPYDYLRELDKTNLITAYKENYLEPYLAGETVVYAFHPYQPYLTNQLMLHTEDNKGKLSGEWYSTKINPAGDKRDCLTFIEADIPYYKGNLVFSRNDNLRNPYSGIQGTFEVNYAKNQIIIIENNPFFNQGNNSYPKTVYGIFLIDESGSRPTLKIEFRENSYPEDFSFDALNFILRDNGMKKFNGE